MHAVKAHRRLELRVIAAGSHLIPPARTIKDVEKQFAVHARVAMQKPGVRTSRNQDARSVARGIAGFARLFARDKPDWVVVLGDRIEAFAAASAASIGGIAVAHIHGGDRAEGVADEAMRHAITKLSHLHLAATEQSAERIVRMGEDAKSVHVVGSPSIDGLKGIKPLAPKELGPWRKVRTLVLLHPAGLGTAAEAAFASELIKAVDEAAHGEVLALAPNLDPGREAILKAIFRRAGTAAGKKWHFCEHLGRARFARLLKTLAKAGDGLLAGNSSAGLIEAAALGVNVLNVGPRQAGRERAGRVAEMPAADARQGSRAIAALLASASAGGRKPPAHPYGDGRSSQRIARLLASVDPHDIALLRKRNAY